jgi:hypothetical protein
MVIYEVKTKVKEMENAWEGRTMEWETSASEEREMMKKTNRNEEVI